MISMFFYRRKSFDIILNTASGIWQRLGWIAKKRALTIILISLLAFAGSFIVSRLSGGQPKPREHDEFSHLLAADTFAGGRLTNPTHPMWEHFESFHIMQKPTYMSIYPPGQGLILAFGQVVFGHPIFGVWLSVSLMCGAICWMLYGWLPPKWAVVGGLISVLNIGTATYWSQSYWGGAFAAFGGALVFGGLRRIIFKLRSPDVLLMAVGLGILANTRPFEGLIITIPVTLVLVAWMTGKKRPPFKKLFHKFIIPLFFVLGVTAFWLGIYNKSVIGDPFKMPQLAWSKQETSVPIFIWQSLKPQLVHQHQELKNLDQDYMQARLERRSIEKLVKISIKSFKTYWIFYIGYFLTIPFILGLFWMIQNRWMQFALLCVFLISFIEPVMLSFNTQVHYSAPIACLFIYLVSQGLRSLSFLRLRDKPVGKLSVLLMLFLLFIPAGKVIAKKAAATILPKRFLEAKQAADKQWNIRRYEIIENLKKEGGRHLIIVRYGKEHNFINDWVYNDADIDKAVVVWAREMDELPNRKLLDYFKGRKVWLLEINDDNLASLLVPYPTSAQTNGYKQ